MFQDRHVKHHPRSYSSNIPPVTATSMGGSSGGDSTNNGISTLEVDSSQDYDLLLGYENVTHTVLRFRRRLNTCDPRDIPITVSIFLYII